MHNSTYFQLNMGSLETETDKGFPHYFTCPERGPPKNAYKIN